MSAIPPAGMPGAWRRVLIALASGAASGVLVLGIGGRVAMAALPVVRGAAPRFSWMGSLEVVVLGALYGLVGGILLELARRAWPMAAGAPLHRRMRRSACVGLALCALAWATSPVGRSTARGAPEPVVLLVIVSTVPFVLHAVLADRFMERWTPAGRPG